MTKFYLKFGFNGGNVTVDGEQDEESGEADKHWRAEHVVEQEHGQADL